MNILETITLRTKERIAEEKQHLPLSEVRRQAEEKQKQADVPDFEAALRAPGLSFICEVKKASPSKGVIAEDFPYLEIAEQLARNLLWKMAEADEMAVHLLYDRQHAYARTCAFLTFVYLFTAEKPIEAAHLNAFWVEAVRTLASRAFGASSYEKRAALTALKRYGRQSDEQAQRVLGELARFKESADAEEREMYHDLAFEFAFEKAAQHDTIINRK